MNKTISFSETCCLTSTLYADMYLIPAENKSIFESSRKRNLNMLECIALENAACDFLLGYEEEAFGYVSENRRAELIQYIRVNGEEGSADILDGYYDTYEFDGYLFGEVWATDNGIIMLTAYRIPEEYQDGEWTSQDWMSNFEPVLFRLT